jgi:hypothetical protein
MAAARPATRLSASRWLLRGSVNTDVDLALSGPATAAPKAVALGQRAWGAPSVRSADAYSGR